MNTELMKAMERMDAACVSGRVMPSEDAWQTIRQALRDLEAENARLREETKAPAVVWRQRAELAESRLATADALLRDFAQAVRDTVDPNVPIKFYAIYARVSAYLQGPTHD